MHNLSKATYLLEQVKEKFPKPPNQVIISIGTFSEIQQHDLEDGFEILARTDSYLENVNIKYITHQGKIQCLDCDYKGSIPSEGIEYSEVHGVPPRISCPTCQSPTVLIISGDEVKLHGINDQIINIT